MNITLYFIMGIHHGFLREFIDASQNVFFRKAATVCLYGKGTL